MAARLNRRHQDMVRDKIRASQLINRLEDHAFGEVELSTTQIKAIEILLKKCIPDLSAVEHSGEINTSPLAEMTKEELLETATALRGYIAAAGGASGTVEAGSAEQPSSVH